MLYIDFKKFIWNKIGKASKFIFVARLTLSQAFTMALQELSNLFFPTVLRGREQFIDKETELTKAT